MNIIWFFILKFIFLNCLKIIDTKNSVAWRNFWWNSLLITTLQITLLLLRLYPKPETTLLGIHNDLILAMDRGEVTSLILLDLSAAFDTVDHSILLHHLQHWFGLHGTSLDWFSSYLTSRSQAVSIQNSTFIFLKSFLWCTSRFHPWPTSFHSLYNSSWLCHLKELNQIPPLCWWHPAVHFFHSFKFNFFTWNALQYFLWHTFLDEL